MIIILILDWCLPTQSPMSRSSRGDNVVAAASAALAKRSTLGCCAAHTFALVSIGISPITLFLQLFSLDYYERQGAYLPVRLLVSVALTPADLSRHRPMNDAISRA